MSTDVVVLDPPSDRSRPGVLSSVRRHALVIAGALVVGALVGFGVSQFLPRTYTASGSFFLSATAPYSPLDTAPGGDPVRFTADQAEIVVTTDVLERAGAALTPPLVADEVRASVIAIPSTATSRVTVTVQRPDPEQARALADAVIDAYRVEARERVDATVNSGVEAASNDPLTQQNIRLRAAAYGDGVETVEPAALPVEPSSPLVLQNALLVGLVALLVALAVSVFRDQRRASRASVADLDLVIGAPLLARYPAPRSSTADDVVVTDRNSAEAHAAQDILTAIDTALEGTELASVLFLSWQRVLTTTSLVVSVGLCAARLGRPVVIVDGGLKERGVSALTDVDPGHGLEALADAEMPLRAALRTWRIDDDSEVGIVPVDGWAPTTTGAAPRPQVLRAATERLGEHADLVLVDGPPLNERSLGLALGRGVEGVVLVVDEQTSIDDAHEMGRRIGLAGVRVVGYVLVGAPRSMLSWAPQRQDEGPLSLRASEGNHRV